MRIGTDKSAYGTHGFSVVGSGATRKLFSKKSSREKFALGDDWSRRATRNDPTGGILMFFEPRGRSRVTKHGQESKKISIHSPFFDELSAKTCFSFGLSARGAVTC